MSGSRATRVSERRSVNFHAVRIERRWSKRDEWARWIMEIQQ